jgi:hypothetical protein
LIARATDGAVVSRTTTEIARLPPSDDAIWSGVDRLIDRAPSLESLRVHRLHLLAAARWRAAGLTIPQPLARAEAAFAIRTSAANRVLEAMRDSCDGPLLLLKGPAVSRLYPDPTRRPFADLDVLVEDPERTQRALVGAGFRPYAGHPDEYYDGHHHLRPLLLDGLPGPFVEIHRRPHWVSFEDAPSAAELFSVATEEASGVEGYVALPPAHHALVIAAHAWAQRPLQRILDFVDVELLAAAGSPQEVARVASRWNLSRLWRVTADAADALIMGARPPRELRTWGRALVEMRDTTVVENHLARLLSPFSVLPFARALGACATALLDEFRPVPDEPWRNKLHRMRVELTHPTRSVSEQARMLGPDHARLRSKRPPRRQ